MNVLVVTKTTDHEGVQLTLNALRARGARVIRLDTDRFPTDVTLAIHAGAGAQRMILRTPNDEIDLADVDSVYYRRVAHGAHVPRDLEPQMRAACVQEARATVEGLITAMRAFHLDPLWNVRRASQKQLQLRVAEEVGLEVPRTLLTNDPHAVRAFAADCPSGMVTKMLASFAIRERGDERVVYTSRIDPEHLADLTGLDLCPMTFQELVPKHLELRVTIVGDRVFASAVDSQRHAHTEVDWRRDGVGLIDAWQPTTLPPPVRAKLLRLMDALGLQYGAADFLLTPEGRLVFLEVNPVGEYFWLDNQHDTRISTALADVLSGRGRRTTTPHSRKTNHEEIPSLASLCL